MNLIHFKWIIYFLSLIVLSECKKFTRCELAKELVKHKFPRTFLSNWVCLIENESGADTTKVNDFPTYSTYGLFQISSKVWCRKGSKGGSCAMKCEDLTKDNIAETARCAQMIYNRHGFLGWKKWETSCKQKPLPNLSSCFNGGMK